VNNRKWVEYNLAKHPWCFDLSHEHARIGGAEETMPGNKYLNLKFQ
jgi:hypothetical protein